MELELRPMYKIDDLVEVKGYSQGKTGIIREVKVHYEDQKKLDRDKDKNIIDTTEITTLEIKYLIEFDHATVWFVQDRLQLVYDEVEMDKFLIDIMLTNRNKYPQIVDRTIGRMDLNYDETSDN
ncbi:hypothetical protein vBBak6_010 [Bacillus phage v_B-Bak6]|uniref:Uncharacterized protein n=1 Tax=Bacillus phage Basilisk TaxID=1296654 RepID=S5M498_9CAUD|nr:hypothetical protein PP653_gp018 [Bacillus phage Basilisk]AGR46681.1 hypothetical protein BASILISK_18 [Bacillus phage Basilisk]AXY82972.1 hypothetical protein vBBak1_010 [Bacillus phage v_B-Bak1]AXY83092.1 hypothetical protein vBBak6_010 [Bacillus phage v_B-Bak6]HDV4621061.1 hypothetical protein [Bacillus anthracis]